MTLQYEELGKDEQCEGNSNVVLKDDLQGRLKPKDWNGNKKPSLTKTTKE